MLFDFPISTNEGGFLKNQQYMKTQETIKNLEQLLPFVSEGVAESLKKALISLRSDASGEIYAQTEGDAFTALFMGKIEPVLKDIATRSEVLTFCQAMFRAGIEYERAMWLEQEQGVIVEGDDVKFFLSDETEDRQRFTGFKGGQRVLCGFKKIGG